MSLFGRATVTCPSCGTSVEDDLVASVNADRRPDLRAAVLDGSFQSRACETCGALLRFPPRFTLVDMARGQWIVAHPALDVHAWHMLETEARLVFERGYGATAPAPAREIGRGLQPRITFGWGALREKLLCRDHGIHDVTLELLKIIVLRDVPGAPFSDASELRLIGLDEDELLLRWLVADSEAALSTLRMPREEYEWRAAPDELPASKWGAVRAALAAGPFVDLARLLMP
jgi:hypothetical protein